MPFEGNKIELFLTIVVSRISSCLWLLDLETNHLQDKQRHFQSRFVIFHLQHERSGFGCMSE